MKQTTTHNILGGVLAVALAALAAVNSAAQTEVEDGDTVRVSARVVRVAVIVPESPGDARLEVAAGGVAKAEFSLDAPSTSPLSLVVLLDISSPAERGWREAGRRLLELPRRLGLQSPPRVVVVGQAPDVARRDLVDGWAVTYARDVRSGFGEAIGEVEHARYPRRALLILTDRLTDLPPRIFEETDERLANESALVYLATVRRQKLIRPGEPDRTVGRMNLNNYRNVVLRASGDYLAASFDYFEQAARELHVVSFPVSEDELATARPYRVEVRAVAASGGRVFNRQQRGVALDQSATFITHARQFPFDAPPPSEPDETAQPSRTPAAVPATTPAVTTTARAESKTLSPSDAAGVWLDSSSFKSLAANPSPLFARIETDADKRAKDIAGLPEWVREGRVTRGPEAEKIRASLAPLIEAYPEASRLELFVYKSDAVFVALAERSLLVISTGAARYFTPQELMSAAAHELSHLYFFEEYLDAFVRRDYDRLQLIELQCDALGMVLSVRAGASPETLSTAVRRHDQLLRQLGEYDPALVNTHPTLAARLAFMGRVRARLEEEAPRMALAGK
jgi:Zn-dependent protease with chaperone function